MNKHTFNGGSEASSIGRRAIHGLILLLAQNLVARACGLLSQLILAALLRPADFGTISLTYTVTTLAITLTKLGIDDVALQRKTALRVWTGPAFWISLSLNSLAAVVVLAISPVAALVYHTPEIVGLLAILALAMPIDALSTVPSIVMRSRMQFSKVAIYGSFEIILQSLLTILFARAGFRAYSFVIPVPSVTILKAFVFWRLASYKTTFRPQVRRWKYVVGNTAANFTNKLIITMIGQGDYITLGLLATRDVVGVYYFGFRLAAQPLWILAGNFNGVLYPLLTQWKADPVKQAAIAFKASTLLSFCVMPLAFVQAAVARPLVSTVFSHRWNASIPVIQLLSVGLALDAVSWVAGALLNSRGEFKSGLKYTLMQAPIFFALVIGGALLDKLYGVAFGVFLYYAITQPLFVLGVYRRVGMTARQVAPLYLKPIFLAGLAVGLALGVSLLVPLTTSPLTRVVVISTTSAFFYAVLVRVLAPDVWIELTSRLGNALRRRVIS